MPIEEPQTKDRHGKEISRDGSNTGVCFLPFFLEEKRDIKLNCERDR